jgi:hypothetical protein
MRQTTIAEVRLDEGNPRSSGAATPRVSPFDCQRIDCDRSSLPRNPQGRKITSTRTGNPENVGSGLSARCSFTGSKLMASQPK